MPFRPNVNDTITIGKATYRFTEHPSAKGMPYGQSGRRGTVYQIYAEEGGTLLALKVFTQSFRVPRVAEGINALRAYAKLPGLQVCARLALTPGQFPQLIAQHPDLEYAVVMPWVEGKTWQEILLEKEAFSRAQSLQVAKAFAHILVEMETRGVAHCDLSGPNVMIKGEDTPEPQVALVDVEDLFAQNLKRPEKLSGGSSGYSHKDASKGLWQASADRFASSVLLAEMLGWCDEDIRNHSFDEQYFPPAEMQVSCERYEQLYGTLQIQWGNPIANLFARAWFSETLDECPTLTEWQRAIIALNAEVIPKKYAWRKVGDEEQKRTVDATTGATLQSELHVKNNTEPAKQEESKPKPDVHVRRSRLPYVSFVILAAIMALGGFWYLNPHLVPPTSANTLVSSLTLVQKSTPTMFTATKVITPTPVLPTITHTPLAPTITPTSTILPTQITDEKGIQMALVPDGTFIMGSTKGENEMPVHDVYLDSYYIDLYEVTNKDYKSCVDLKVCESPVGSNKSYSPYNNLATHGNSPVVYVTWDMADAYCKWRDARLPTEAEWEKAARGIDGRIFPWGNQFECSGYANFWSELYKFGYSPEDYCSGGLTPVGLYEKGKSPYGVYDIAGNALEWVFDYFDPNYYKISPMKNPQGPTNDSQRVVRGGNFEANSMSYFDMSSGYVEYQYTRSTFRFGREPARAISYIGFRCARSIP